MTTQERIIEFDSTRFGSIRVGEDKIIHFVKGIPGFERLKRYILIDHDPEGLFKWLQSVDDPEVAFLLTYPTLFKPDYNLPLRKADLDGLEIDDINNLVILVMVCVSRKKGTISLNLKGPVLFNSKNMKARQYIVDADDFPCGYEVKLSSIKTEQKREKISLTR